MRGGLMRNSADMRESKIFNDCVQQYKDKVLSKVIEQQRINWFWPCDLLLHEATIYIKKVDPGYNMHTDVITAMQDLPYDLERKTYFVHLPARFKEICDSGFKNDARQPQIAEPGRVYRI
jgi:hypothetical protein